MYQIDRTACAEVGEMSGSEIPIGHRLDWVTACREGKIDHVTQKELEKYLRRGLAQMPWVELSQKDFLDYVVPYKVLSEEELLKQSILVMGVVVSNPERLLNSAFHHGLASAMHHNGVPRHSAPNSPTTNRKNLSRTNSLRRSIKEVQLRRVPDKDKPRAGSRPSSMVMA